MNETANTTCRYDENCRCRKCDCAAYAHAGATAPAGCAKLARPCSVEL